MGLNSLINAQKAIDSYEYPPTHTYDVRTLEPRSPLKERLTRILECCPGLFDGQAFLDIGASKGFFSLKAAKKARVVVAVEPDGAALATWDCIRTSNIFALNMPFKSFTPEIKFDTIWNGNGPHYLSREDDKWIERIKGMLNPGGSVVLEGPTGPECPDMKGFGDWYRTERNLIDGMKDNGLSLIRRVDSYKYTPGRAIWNFKMN